MQDDRFLIEPCEPRHNENGEHKANQNFLQHVFVDPMIIE